MVAPSANDRNQPLAPPTPGGIPAQVVELLKGASPAELGEIQAHLSQEMHKCLERVKRQQKERQEKDKRELEDMEKAFGLSESKPISRKKSITKGSGEKPTRAPRGEAKKLLLDFLNDGEGSKSYEQIEAHFKNNGFATSSIPMLLKREIESGTVTSQDDKEYSRSGEKQ
jgi:hypothetical protein